MKPDKELMYEDCKDITNRLNHKWGGNSGDWLYHAIVQVAIQERRRWSEAAEQMVKDERERCTDAVENSYSKRGALEAIRGE